MGYTKYQFIEAALEEIGIASYNFDLQPEQIQSALKRMDSMMASWNGLGIQVGYPLPSSPELSDVYQETGVPDSANQAIISNLALKIAPSYGKQVSPDTRLAAKQSYSVLVGKAAAPVSMQLPANMPAGAGHKGSHSRSNVFLSPPVDKIQTGNGGFIDWT